jgi:transcriptional regulator with XRE-family HTH domain
VPRQPSSEALGRAIRQRRGDRLNQRQLADRAGIHRTYLTRIEAGQENPSWRVLCDIADALGITISELAADAESVASRKKR